MLAVRALDLDHPPYHDGITLRLNGNDDAFFWGDGGPDTRRCRLDWLSALD